MSARPYPLAESKGHWLLGQLPAFRRDRLRFLTETTCRAPIVRLRLGHKRVYCLSDPDLIQDMQVTQHAHMARERTLREVFARTMGNSLLTADGPYWKRQRRMLAPAFQRQRVPDYAPIMVQQAAAAAERWQDGQEADIERQMNALTLGIVTAALFHVDSGNQADLVADAIAELQAIGIRQLARAVPLPSWLPTSENRRQRELSRRVRDVVIAEIRRRRAASGDGGNDLLDKLIQARDPDTGEQMHDEEICDEVITLYLAGYDTTSLALSFCWYELALHPDIEARFHDELDRVLAGRLPTADDVDRLPYTQMLFKETLRLHPPVYFQLREVAEAVEIGGHQLPAGSILITSPYAMHRRPDLWDEPQRFDPERFAGGAERGWHRFRYFPFGGGPRICIGQHFAVLEGTLLLATIGRLDRFELLDPEQRVEMEPQITLGPKGGLPLRIRRRVVNC